MNTNANRATRTCLLTGALLWGAGSAWTQDSPAHPTVSMHMVLRYRLEGSAAWSEVPLEMASQMMPARLDQEIEVPGLETPIRVVEYLPLAEPRQRIEADASAAARPAVMLAIKGPKLSYERCLITDSPRRNRMTSLIATWRYARADDEQARSRLYADFLEEPTRDPRLLVSLEGEGVVRSVPVAVGRTESLEELGCEVRVLEFFSHYNFDELKGEAVNLSDERRNPAALVEIVGADGESEERWIFARFPEYVSANAGDARYSVTLDCAVQKETPTPDFVLVVIERSRHELWTRFADEVTTRPLAPSETVEIPGAKYTFEIQSFVPAARIVEEFSPTKDRRGALTALRIEFTNASEQPDTRWLELERDYSVELPSSVLTVNFGLKQDG